MAPLVDVVFLLVIFFAVSTTFLETSGLPLELPQAGATAERASRELTIFLDQAGKLSFEGETVTMAVLEERLPEALEKSANKVVVLRADTTVPHGKVVTLMDAVRRAGAEGLTIATRPDE
jgi:biopolymer transport protein ExbD